MFDLTAARLKRLESSARELCAHVAELIPLDHVLEIVQLREDVHGEGVCPQLLSPAVGDVESVVEPLERGLLACVSPLLVADQEDADGEDELGDTLRVSALKDPFELAASGEPGGKDGD